MKYLLCLLIPTTAHAGRVISESVATTKAVLYVDTKNAHVDLATTSYSGSINNVALFTSSNAIFSSDGKDRVVIYSTGSEALAQINWPDGSISTSANSGNIQLVGNTGPWTQPATAHPSASTFTYINGFATQVMYVVHYNLVQNTSAANLLVQVNADATANKHNWNDVTRDYLRGLVGSANINSTSCQITESTARAGTTIHGYFVIASAPGATSQVTLYGFSYYIDSGDATAVNVNQFSCLYNNNTFSALEIMDSAGTLTGDVSVEKLANP